MNVTGNDETLDQLLDAGLRLLWVAAHPDDESFGGPILAKTSLRCGNPLQLLVLTHGEGGEDSRKGGAPGALAELRAAEMEEVARRYNATLRMERFFNAPLPVESFPPRHEIAERWLAHEDPTRIIAETIRAFRPGAILTLAPRLGTTGHPEHELAARFAMTGAQLAADADADLPGEAHRVPRAYYLLNHYWFVRLFGMRRDPLGATESFDARQPCTQGRRCTWFMAENSRPHRTQNNDMRLMRVAARLIRKVYLRRVDPLTERLDPFEPAASGGMSKG